MLLQLSFVLYERGKYTSTYLIVNIHSILVVRIKDQGIQMWTLIGIQVDRGFDSLVMFLSDATIEWIAMSDDEMNLGIKRE
jgi:hypothetical protein